MYINAKMIPAGFGEGRGTKESGGGCEFNYDTFKCQNVLRTSTTIMEKEKKNKIK
jgi:hypothetical protein